MRRTCSTRSAAAGRRGREVSCGRASVPGAESYSDGLANTNAMAEAGSPLAQWARGLRIDGHDDWYLPSRDELELMYRNLKPTTQENDCTFRDGDNPSSVPVGYPYTALAPTQTTVAAFAQGGAQALDARWYWSSTQYAAVTLTAWSQGFDIGLQLSYRKSAVGRARAVRRFKI